MTPGAAARSLLNKRPLAMTTGCDQASFRQNEHTNVAVPSSFGSSQLRMILPCPPEFTLGVRLPTGAGATSSRQLLAEIREPVVELQPANPTIENGTANARPTVAEA